MWWKKGNQKVFQRGTLIHAEQGTVPQRGGNLVKEPPVTRHGGGKLLPIPALLMGVSVPVVITRCAVLSVVSSVWSLPVVRVLFLVPAPAVVTPLICTAPLEVVRCLVPRTVPLLVVAPF